MFSSFSFQQGRLAQLGVSWAPLRLNLELLGRLLGAFWPQLGRSWDQLGALLRAFGPNLGALEANLGPT